MPADFDTYYTAFKARLSAERAAELGAPSGERISDLPAGQQQGAIDRLVEACDRAAVAPAPPPVFGNRTWLDLSGAERRAFARAHGIEHVISEQTMRGEDGP